MSSFEASLKDKLTPSDSCSGPEPKEFCNESPLDWSGNSENDIHENEKSCMSNDNNHIESKTSIKRRIYSNFRSNRPNGKIIFLLPFTSPAGVVGYALFAGNASKMIVE